MLVQHFKSLLMPAYRSISYVKVGDGSETSFWEDQWMIDTTLAAKFPALHTHFMGGDMSVQQADDPWPLLSSPTTAHSESTK